MSPDKNTKTQTGCQKPNGKTCPRKQSHQANCPGVNLVVGFPMHCLLFDILFGFQFAGWATILLMSMLSGASLVVWFLVYSLVFAIVFLCQFTGWGTIFLRSLLSGASLVAGFLICCLVFDILIGFWLNVWLALFLMSAFFRAVRRVFLLGF